MGVAKMAPAKTSLFGCCDDPGICVKGWCCPGCVYGETDEIVEDRGSCAMGCLKFHFCGICTVCLWAPNRRTAMRSHFDIDDECGGDSSPGSAVLGLPTAKRGASF